MALKLFMRRVSRPELVEEVRYDEEQPKTALTYVSVFTYKGDSWRSVFVAPEHSTMQDRAQMRFQHDVAFMREHDLDMLNTIGIQEIAS